jgi:lysophospholipase L1-like esterase
MFVFEGGGSVADPRIRFVALGDSYTVGTSVAQADRWPDQLVGRIPELVLAGNLAINGYASRDVLERELPQLPRLAPDLVSLLIGVNDVVRGVPPDAYRRTVTTVLDALAAATPAPRILSIATPDYTVTPQGASYGDPDRQRAGIVTNNGILEELAQERGIPFVDIFDISGRAATDRELVARDGLHPSGTQYRLWVDRIEPVVRGLISGAQG